MSDYWKGLVVSILIKIGLDNKCRYLGPFYAEDRYLIHAEESPNVQSCLGRGLSRPLLPSLAR